MCVWKRGGAIFLTLMGGGHAILSSRNGGVSIFFLTPGHCLPPPPSAEIYERSLILTCKLPMLPLSHNAPHIGVLICSLCELAGSVDSSNSC